MIIGALSVNNKLVISLNIMISNEQIDYLCLMNKINSNAIKHLQSNIKDHLIYWVKKKYVSIYTIVSQKGV